MFGMLKQAHVHVSGYFYKLTRTTKVYIAACAVSEPGPRVDFFAGQCGSLDD